MAERKEDFPSDTERGAGAPRPREPMTTGERHPPEGTAPRAGAAPATPVAVAPPEEDPGWLGPDRRRAQEDTDFWASEDRRVRPYDYDAG